VNEDLLTSIAGAVSRWERETRAQLIGAHPSDWEPEKLYAEWIQSPVEDNPRSSYYSSIRAGRKKGVFFNGYSTDREAAGHLKGLLQIIEQEHGIVIDGITVVRDEGYISALWHMPGIYVRRYSNVPLAAAAAVLITSENSEKGVV